MPVQIRDTRYTIDRTGVLGSLSWQLGFNHLEAGFWIEDNTQQRSTLHLDQRHRAVQPGAVPGQASRIPPNGSRRPRGRREQFYVQDTVTLFDDALSVDFGFKSTYAKSDAQAMRGIAKAAPPASSQFASGTLVAKDNFLPEVGVRWEVARGHELFASYAENMAMFQGGFKLGPQSVSQAIWDVQGKTLKPETSKSFEGGYRYVSGPLQVSLTGYWVDFNNRLLQYNPARPTSSRTRAAAIPSTMPAASPARAWSLACCGSRRRG